MENYCPKCKKRVALRDPGVREVTYRRTKTLKNMVVVLGAESSRSVRFGRCAVCDTRCSNFCKRPDE